MSLRWYFVFEQLNYTKTRVFHAILLPVIIEFSMYIGNYSSAKFELLKVQNAIFRFVPKSMFQQMGFGKSDFLKLCNTMMELDFSDSIYKVSCPTLVIYGEKDRANQNASIELANMLIDAELQVFSGAGHEINIEAPDKLVETLRVFFSRV